jgi:hypothetical protein
MMIAINGPKIDRMLKGAAAGAGTGVAIDVLHPIRYQGITIYRYSA